MFLFMVLHKEAEAEIMKFINSESARDHQMHHLRAKKKFMDAAISYVQLFKMSSGQAVFKAFHDLNYFSRLLRFDTETETSSEMTDPLLRVHNATCFVFKNLLYMVGGYDCGFLDTVYTFDLETSQRQRLVHRPFSNNPFESLTSSCFDGQDYIYMLSNNAKLIRMSVHTNEITQLANIPIIETSPNNLVYCPAKELHKLFYISDSKTFSYCIFTNRWAEISPLPTAFMCCGIVGVSNRQ
eukprot:gene17875-21315_t